MSTRMEVCRTTELTKQVGRVIKYWRTNHQISQRALAKVAGCPRSLISTIERGAHSPSIDTLQRILTALGYSYMELFQATADAPWTAAERSQADLPALLPVAPEVY